MAVRRRKKRSLTRFIAPLATMLILGYFGFHSLNGQYGIRAQLAMELRMVELEQKLAERTAVRDHLEARVAMLNDGTMEKDMVDQYVRSQLNMAREDEVILLINGHRN